MTKTIDYYLALVSPWTYFGHDPFRAIARRHGARIEMMPVDLGRIFPVSGGLPLSKRAPQRQAYRLVELARWSDLLGMPLNAQPKFAASGGDLASKWVIAASAADADAAFDLAGAILRARWAEERDIADAETLGSIARSLSLDSSALAAAAADAGTTERYDTFTQRAIDAQVFGVPWYVYRGEPFWGQDRLDMLDRALAK
jgi:2-hydroxychromene-2-carboxylate isomerase